MKIKFKPVYRYQSAEFEWDTDEMPLDKAFDCYKMLLEGLKEVADEVCPDEGQPKVISKKKEEPKVELATDKQKEIMIKFDIPYTSRTTKAEARALISKSFEESKE